VHPVAAAVIAAISLTIPWLVTRGPPRAGMRRVPG
jgi:hypothetical protein